MKSYIYKRRDIKFGKFNRFNFDLWRSVSKHKTFKDALDALLNDKFGLYDSAVFYGGKRLTDCMGKILEDNQKK